MNEGRQQPAFREIQLYLLGSTELFNMYRGDTCEAIAGAARLAFISVKAAAPELARSVLLGSAGVPSRETLHRVHSFKINGSETYAVNLFQDILS